MRRHRKGDESIAHPEPRAPLPPRVEALESVTDEQGMTHTELVEALRAIDGLDDVGRDPPNFHFCGRPFLHFHERDGRVYADVWFEHGFEPVWASSPLERNELLGRVADHVERVARTRKSKRRHPNR